MRERESIKARTTKKCEERCEQGEREKDRRGSTRWTAGPRSRGSSSGSGRAANVILSSRLLLQMQQPKLYSNLTFQNHGLFQLSLLSLSPLPLPRATHHFLPPSALFHLFSFIALSYSCHISSATPNLFLSIAPPAIFLSITLPRYVSSSHGNSAYILSRSTLDVVEWRAESIVPA